MLRLLTGEITAVVDIVVAVIDYGNYGVDEDPRNLCHRQPPRARPCLFSVTLVAGSMVGLRYCRRFAEANQIQIKTAMFF